MKEDSSTWVRTLPNRLSLTRLGLVPVLLILAFASKPTAFLVVFGVGLFTDFLDGFLARLLRVQSEWGAKLDSWADALSWIAFTCGALTLWPEQLLEVSLWVAAALLAFLIPGLYGLAKYHQLPGFHTWSAKAAMAGMGVSVLLMFSGITPLPFYISVGLLGLVCVEETLMVHWLPEPRQDLHTAVAAWRLTRKTASPG